MQITTDRFDFQTLIRSHGWRALAPFHWNPTSQTLMRPLHLSDGASTGATITCTGDGEKNVFHIRLDKSISADDRAIIRDQVRRMLCLDEDLNEFHRICAGDPALWFVHESRSGRMLRSPNAFEDLIKTICTTNCSWGNTTSMCVRLCDLSGGNFPLPAQLLKFSPAQLARRVPLGYRARTVLQIARLVERGKLPVDEWAAQRDFDRIRAALSDIWGVGPYALNHMLMLLGDYSAIPIDSEVLKYLRKMHFNGEKVHAKDAVAPYLRYGRFQFLAFKFARLKS
jgi:3-methyladenine DNA glycosylase/8-oxoguanine DNA glycosylase